MRFLYTALFLLSIYGNTVMSSHQNTLDQDDAAALLYKNDSQNSLLTDIGRILTQQLEVGPFEVTADQTAEYEKTDVAETQDGVATQYILTVMRSGVVVSGVRLDFWAANAQGVYSGIASENTANEDYLRGWQVTDDNGQATFDGIYVGPYNGRTNHIHLRIREYESDGVTTTFDDTTQLFFPASLTTEVMQLDAYIRTNTNSENVVNSNDRIYTSENEMTLTGSSDTGFVAAYTIELPLTYSSSNGYGLTVIVIIIAGILVMLFYRNSYLYRSSKAEKLEPNGEELRQVNH